MHTSPNVPQNDASTGVPTNGAKPFTLQVQKNVSTEEVVCDFRDCRVKQYDPATNSWKNVVDNSYGR